MKLKAIKKGVFYCLETLLLFTNLPENDRYLMSYLSTH